MERNQNISNEKREQIKKIMGGYDLSYKHNGAEVFISRKRKENKYGYGMDASVCVIKGDKSLTFSIGESIGNEHGTIFTRATVLGAPTRNNIDGDISEGMYPYDTFTKLDQKENQDILTRAAIIYSHYDKETNGNIKIGEIFKSYVPSSYEAIQKELNTQDQKPNEDKEKLLNAQKMKHFRDSLGNF